MDVAVTLTRRITGWRISVHGELDADTSGLLTGGARAVLLAAPRADLELDLAGITFLDLRGLSSVLDTMAAIRARGVRPVVVDCSAAATRLAELACVGDQLAVAPTGYPGKAPPTDPPNGQVR